MEKFFSVNDLPISNYGNVALKTRLVPEFVLRERASSKKPHCTVIYKAYIKNYEAVWHSITFL